MCSQKGDCWTYWHSFMLTLLRIRRDVSVAAAPLYVPAGPARDSCLSSPCLACSSVPPEMPASQVTWSAVALSSFIARCCLHQQGCWSERSPGWTKTVHPGTHPALRRRVHVGSLQHHSRHLPPIPRPRRYSHIVILTPISALGLSCSMFLE